MRQVADLLREALRHGDEQGRTQILGKHLPEHLFADLAAQTHRYAMEHAEDAGEGWLVFKEGISGWWIRAGGLADHEFNRLYMLRADVVKRLTEQGLAYRPESQVDAASCAEQLSHHETNSRQETSERRVVS